MNKGIKFLLRTIISLFVPAMLFLSCGGGGSSYSPPVEYSITIQQYILNGSIQVKDNRTRAPKGTAITLEIQAEDGFGLTSLNYTVAGGDPVDIYGNGNYDPRTNTATFTMPEGDVLIDGTFQHNSHPIVIIRNPITGGKVSTSPSNNALYTDDVEVKVTANQGYRIAKTDSVYFSYFDTTGAITKTPLNAPYGFSMPDSLAEVTVNFEKTYPVTIINSTINGTTVGTVSTRDKNGSRATDFAAGDLVTVRTSTALSNNYYVIDKITAGDLGDISDTKNFTMPDHSVEVTVTYTLNPNNQYQITIANTNNGTIAPKDSPDGNTDFRSAKAGDLVYLDIQPIPGYQLKANSLDAGTDVTINVPPSGRPWFEMPAHPITVNGSFEKKDLDVTALSVTGGNIRFLPGSASQIKAQLDSIVTFTVRANSGYRLKTESVKYSYFDGMATQESYLDPTSISNSTTPPTYNYSFTMKAYPVTVSAEFERTYTITINNTIPEGASAAPGVVSYTNASGASTFAALDKVNVGVTVTNTYYVLDTIVTDTAEGDITNTGSFIMPGNNVYVTVAYKLNPNNLYGINVGSLNNGTIGPRTSSSANTLLTEAKAGALVYLDVQPNPGYQLQAGSISAGTGVTITYPVSGRPYFTMPARIVTVTGTFEKTNLNINAPAVTGGSISLGRTTAQLDDPVTFTVTPAANYRLKAGTVKYSWNGVDYNPSFNGTAYSFTMPAYDVTVKAVFEPIYGVTVNNITPQGASVVPGSVTTTNANGQTGFAEKDIVNVSVTVTNNYYVLDKITVSTSENDITSTASFTMPAGPVTVTVTYKLNPENLYGITVTSAANGTIETRAAATGTASLTQAKAGISVYLDIQPSTGYQLKAGSLSTGTSANVIVPASGRPYFTMPAQSVIVSGVFEKRNYTVSTPAVSGGSITLGKTMVQLDDPVTFTVKPDSNYRLIAGTVKYSYGGNDYTPTVSSGTYSFNMPASDVTVKAEFEQIYSIIVDNVIPVGASIAPGNVSYTNASGVLTYAKGDTINVSVDVTDDRYMVDVITLDNPSGNVTAGSFTMPPNNVTIKVTYKDNPGSIYSLSLGNLSNGNIQFYDSASSGNIISSAMKTSTVYLDIKPSAGYQLKAGTLTAGSGVTIVDPGSGLRPYFEMPARGVTVSAMFEKKNLTISAPTVTGGNISLGKTTAQLDDSVTFTVTQDTNYRLKAGAVKYSYTGADYNPSLSGTTYSFTMPAYDVTVKAVFEPIYNVNVNNTVPAGAGVAPGTVSITNASGAGTFASGDTVNVGITITNNMYVVDKITVNTGAGEITAVGYFTMPGAPVTVTVSYKLNPDYLYGITVTTPSNGTIETRSTATGNTVLNEAKAGTVVYLAIQPVTGYQLKAGSLDAGTGVNIIVPASGRSYFTMPAQNVTVSGTFEKRNYNVSIGSISNGSISLGKAAATLNENVTFTVTPNSNYRLKAGTVKYTYNGSDYIPALTGGTYSFNMPAYDVTVKAEFERIYTVTLFNNKPVDIITDPTASFNNTSGESTYAAGDTIDVSVIINDEDWIINTINVEPGIGNIAASMQFTMPASNVTITVTYKLKKEYYSVTLGSLSNGTIQFYNDPVNGSMIASAMAGDKVYLDIQPVNGYQLKAGSLNAGTGVIISTTGYPPARPYFTMPEANVILNAEFELKYFNITGTADPGGGWSVTPSPAKARMGDNVTITVSTTNDYRFNTGSVRYTYNGKSYTPSGSGNVYNFTMPAYDVSVSATINRLWDVDTSGVDPSKGIVTVTNTSNAAAIRFIADETVNIKASAMPGYRVVSINVSGVGTITTGSFKMPAFNVTVSVTFEVLTYDINIDDSVDNGDIYANSAEGVGKAKGGDTVTLTIQPGTGYKYVDDSLTVKNGTADVPFQITGLTATFAMPYNSVLVSCSLVKKSYTIQKADASVPNGSITITNGDTVNYGDLVTIQANPAKGYRIGTLTYYSSVQGSSAAVSIPKIGDNYQFTVPDFPDRTVIMVYAAFVLAEYPLSVSPGITEGKFTFMNPADSIPIYSAKYNDQIKVLLVLNDGYSYVANSFRVNGNILSGQTESNYGGVVEFSFFMPDTQVVVSAQFLKNKLNVTSATSSNGTVSITPSGLMDYGTTITITAVPNTGYRLNRIELRKTANVINYLNIDTPSADNKYAMTMSNFLTSTSNNDQIQVVGLFGLQSYNLSYIPVSGVNIFFNTSSPAPYLTPVTVALVKSGTKRYKPMSFKLNGVTPVDLPPGYISSYSFTMPAYDVVISVESENIPMTSLDFNDPNKDSYFHFYDSLTETEITSAASGQTVHLEAYMPLYPGAGPNEIVIIQNMVVKSWMLNSKIIANSAECTIPPGSGGKSLGVLVEIDGVPYSKSIQVTN